MLAQWLIRFSQVHWRNSERTQASRLALAYAGGTALALCVTAVMALAMGAGPALGWFVLGWVAWSGMVAVGVWRLVQRIDSSPPPRGTGGDDGDVGFVHYLANGRPIEYRRNPAWRGYDPDLVYPETPEYGFPREGRR